MDLHKLSNQEVALNRQGYKEQREELHYLCEKGMITPQQLWTDCAQLLHEFNSVTVKIIDKYK